MRSTTHRRLNVCRRVADVAGVLRGVSRAEAEYIARITALKVKILRSGELIRQQFEGVRAAQFGTISGGEALGRIRGLAVDVASEAGDSPANLTATEAAALPEGEYAVRFPCSAAGAPSPEPAPPACAGRCSDSIESPLANRSAGDQ